MTERIKLIFLDAFNFRARHEWKGGDQDSFFEAVAADALKVCEAQAQDPLLIALIVACHEDIEREVKRA